MDKDLKINIGPKFVLGALDPSAYEAYTNSHNLKKVIDKIKSTTSADDEDEDSNEMKSDKPKLKKSLSTNLTVMTPIKPMLADSCNSMEEPFEKSPKGFYAEIKYDGERIQIHKNGDQFSFFSRNMKTVTGHKVEGLDKTILAATKAKTCILDGEILCVDSQTLKMLPFGTLGVHKKKQYPNAQICYFIFDILYFEGETLMSRPLKERKEIISNNFKELTARLKFSEGVLVQKPADLEPMWEKVLEEGLEGLVLKDMYDTYKPTKRHWMKLKKDYLSGMGDSVDLTVLGAFYGKVRQGLPLCYSHYRESNLESLPLS